MVEHAEPTPTEVLRGRGYKSPFSRFDGQSMCPHCGRRWTVSQLPAREVVTLEDGGELRGVECPGCHSPGQLLVPAE